MNETPMMFSGLEAQGEINQMGEVFGCPEQICRGVPRGRVYPEMAKICAEYEADKPDCVRPGRERMLELDFTTG